MFMTSEQMTAEQRVQKAIIAIMQNQKYVALAGILMIGERVITDDPSIPTACTNGRDEMYNRDFVDKLNDAELRFLILHESYHKLYRHITTWKWIADINTNEANICMDFVINIKLVDDNKDGFATMTGELANGCIDPKYRDMDTAQVYHARKKNGEGQDTGISNPDGDGNLSETTRVTYHLTNMIGREQRR
jgi:predicted metal-dependent peptidase